jgi:predicted transcriptional regulator
VGEAMDTITQGVASSKEIIRDLLKRLPDDVSLQDIAHEIEFIAAIRQGVAELDRGESVPIEEVEAEMATWIIR